MTYVRKPAEPWMSPNERERHHRIEFVIEEALNKPPVRLPQLNDHAWDPCANRCVVCGITKLDFHNTPYGVGLPCHS